MTDINPAIFFHPDQIEGKDKDLVGRRSAGQSFLKGFLRNHRADRINAVVETADAAKALAEAAGILGETRPIDTVVMRGGGDFTKAGTVFFPTPGYQRAPWLRQRYGAQSCSFVGITHTVSTRRIMEGLHTLLAEPVEDWDAIICTSRAVQSVVKRQFALEAEYYRQRFGAMRTPQPQLPVIPLGIETADFAPLPGARERMRAARGVPDDGIVIMTMGRLSVVEKANPVPLFMALEMLAQQLKVPLHLWMVGWASRPEEEALHRDGAAAIAKSVTTTIIDGRDPDTRRNIWAGADLFTRRAAGRHARLGRLSRHGRAWADRPDGAHAQRSARDGDHACAAFRG
jgi:alpha-maltose-1-phosphate synthase